MPLTKLLRMNFLWIAAAFSVLSSLALPVLLPQPADAVGCGPCLGPVRSASGSAQAGSCAAALDAAYQQALINAYADAPDCVPCEISEGPAACFAIDFTGQWGATRTVNYKCRACDFGPLIPNF